MREHRQVFAFSGLGFGGRGDYATHRPSQIGAVNAFKPMMM
jgi:hypothetical protein